MPDAAQKTIEYSNEKWYSKSVEFLSSYGINLGDNKDRDIVRYELAEWLVKVFIQPEDKQYLEIAKELKIISSESTNDYITRNETAKMITKFFSK